MAAALPWVVAAATAASAVVSAVGARRQAQAQSQAATYNAQVAEQNAESARQQAQVQAAQIQRQNRLRLGKIRASAGAAGIQLQGSVIDIIGDVTAQGELERQNALWEGEMRARGFNIDRDLSRAQARDARASGRLAVAGTLLQGAAGAGSQFVQLGGGRPGGKPSGGGSGPHPASGFGGI